MGCSKDKHNLFSLIEEDYKDIEEKLLMQTLNLEWDDYQGYINSEELH